MLSSFQQGVITVVCINVIVVLGMSVLTGFTRLFSFGNASFMSIGAYASAICSVRFGLPFPAKPYMVVGSGLVHVLEGRQIFEIIREINAGGTAVLLIEQNANKALAICSRADILSVGNVVEQGSREVLQKSETLTSAYLG